MITNNNDEKDMIKKFIIHNLLLLILILAAVLRLWKLDVNPPHLSPDEAALGYNAYSILKTGRDEYGELLPLIFKSFGDYKPGLYVYLTVPFVALFGLNEWSVRLPGALAGVVAVWLLYLVIRKLKILDKSPNLQYKDSKLGLIASFLLAVSPWHIHFSRGAWEINVSLTLTLAATYMFLKSLSQQKYLIPTSIIFALTLITYQGAKLSSLIVVTVLSITFWKNIQMTLKTNFRLFIISVFAFAVTSLPILYSFKSGQTGRLKVFSIFSYPRPQEYLQKFLGRVGEKRGDTNYYFYHTEALNFGRGILGRYFNHFSGRFLFFEGDYQNPKHSSPNHGMLLLFNLLVLPTGVISLIKKRGAIRNFTFIWLFLSPLPAVLTRDQVQAVRAYNMVIPLTIISAFGVTETIKLLHYLLGKLKLIGIFSTSFYAFLFIGSLFYFLDSYFIHLPVHGARYWNWGYRQVIEEILPIKDNYKTIFFQQSYDQPYIYFLFYSKYDPVSYQKQANLSYYLGPDVGLVEKLDNIKFAGWSWPYATGQKSTLIVGNSVAIPRDYNPNDYRLISEIKYPDGFMTAYRILETK